MPFITSYQRGMFFILLAVLLSLAACGSTTAAKVSTSTPVSTVSATTATTVTGTNAKPTTALCNLMSLSQVSGVVGGTLSTLTSTITMSNGNTAVNCTYLPTQGNGAHLAGEISYLFSTNGSTSYAAAKSDQTSRGETETDLSGLGDAAFWAVAAKNVGTLQLTVLKGNVILEMTLLGANPDGSSMLNGAIALAKLALPSI